MTVEDVLHSLWTNSTSTLEKYDEKRLWLLLQQFISEKGGRRLEANAFDVRRGLKELEDIRPVPTVRRVLGKMQPHDID